MAMPATATVTKERDVRMHAELWHTSKCLLQRGQEQEEGSVLQFRASLVFTTFALEAYLNWLADQFVANWDYLERRLELKDKIKVVSRQLGVVIDLGKPPGSIVGELVKFRNLMAHGKPAPPLTSETTEPADEHLDAKLGERLRAEWELYCTEKSAEQAIAAACSIAETLHKAAKFGESESSDPFFSGFQVHSAKLKSDWMDP